MLEYTFFHQQPFETFLRFLKEKAIQAEVEIEEEVRSALIPENLEAEVLDRIEQRYDELLGENESLFSAEHPDEQLHTAGLSVTMPQDRELRIPVEPALMNRLLSVASPAELGEFANHIAQAVLNPDYRPFCERHREGDL